MASGRAPVSANTILARVMQFSRDWSPEKNEKSKLKMKEQFAASASYNNKIITEKNLTLFFVHSDLRAEQPGQRPQRKIVS